MTNNRGGTGRARPSGTTAPAVRLALALALAVTAAGAATARAAAAVEVENARVGFGGLNNFKVGAWTPVWVQLRGGDEKFAGFLDLIVTDDDGVPSTYRQPVELNPKATERYVAYTRPGGRDSDFTIRLLDARGNRVKEVVREVAMPLAPAAIMPDERWILTLGQPMGVDQVPTLPGLQPRTPRAGGGGASEFVVTRIEPQSGMMPGRWYGFDGADSVVIDTNDREAMKALDGPRGRALVDWVARGGHLVLGVGASWQAVKDSVLGPILPAEPAGQERVPSLEALDTFAGANKPITPVGTPPVMVTKMEGAEGRGGKVLSILASLPLVVRGPHGFGRVTLIALDVDQRLFSEWEDRGLFWARALDLRRDRGDDTPGAPKAGGNRFYQSGVSDLSSQLRIALEQFPGVKLIPFGWIAFAIFLYVLLIGPGDYLFLRKVLKRMELTWITFPAIVLGVSFLSYFAAYKLKGSDLLVNKVDLIDLDQTSGQMRGRTWTTVFSPQNRDYNFGFVPAEPASAADLPPAASTPSGEPARPPAGTEVMTTWFSVPENNFGGMGGNSRRFSFVGGGYLYQPASTVEQLRGVRIPIWSTKSITAQWFGPAGPVLDSDLRPVGTDRLAGTVTNRQAYPLDDAILAFGKQVYLLGTIAPGQTIRVELSGDRNLSGHLRSRQPNYLPDQPWNRETRLNRADLVVAIMFHDSASGRSTENRLANAPLGNLDLTGQLALERPMLVARIPRPGAQLAIGNASVEPRVDQTSVLRVILPLKRSPGSVASLAADAAGAAPARN